MLNSAASYDNPFFHNNVYGHALELLKRHRTKPHESGPERIHLDLGCGYGRIAEPLTEALELRYVGVDANAVALASLRERGFETHELVLDGSDRLLDNLRDIVRNRVIASITMLDTVEHLSDGDAVLDCLRALAIEHRTLMVLSVPNMTHRDIGFKLAFGRLNYTAVGLLDYTHLRLFSADYFEGVLRHAGLYCVDRLDVRVSISDQHFPATHPALSRSTSLHRLLRTLRAQAEPNDDVNQFVWLCTSGPQMAEQPFVTPIKNPRPFLSIITRTQGKRAQSLVEVFTCLAGQSVIDFEVLVIGHRLSHSRQLLVERVIEDNPAWLRERTRLLLVDRGNRTHPLNVGFGVARGDYIAILDDDDTPMAHWVETFKVLAEENPGCLLRASVVRQNVVNTSVLGKVGVRAVGTCEKAYPSEFDFLEHLRGNHTPPICVAFPRGAFHDLNIRFDEELTTTEDWDYIMRVATIADTASSPKITSIYHWWVNGDSSRTDHPTHEWVINHQRIFQKMDQDMVLFPKGTSYAIRSLLDERDYLRQQLAAEVAKQAEQTKREQRGKQEDQESGDLEQDPWLQVFANKGSGYNETDSRCQQIVRNKLSKLRFPHIERLYSTGRFPLRIDPVNVPAILQLFSIRIVRDTDGALLYAAEIGVDFAKLNFSDGLISHVNGFALFLVSPGPDPQIYLPLFDDLREEPCTLEITLQVHSTDLRMISFCCQADQTKREQLILQENEQLRQQLASEAAKQANESGDLEQDPWLQVFANKGSGYNETVLRQQLAADEEAKRAKLRSLLSSKSWLLSAPVRVLAGNGERDISTSNSQGLVSSQLDEAILKVYASTSWKVTALLRKVDEALHRGVKLVSRS